MISRRRTWDPRRPLGVIVARIVFTFFQAFVIAANIAKAATRSQRIEERAP